jgi:hypothetical protein
MQVKINRIMLPAYSYFIASGYPQSDMDYLSGRNKPVVRKGGR